MTQLKPQPGAKHHLRKWRGLKGFYAWEDSNPFTKRLARRAERRAGKTLTRPR